MYLLDDEVISDLAMIVGRYIPCIIGIIFIYIGLRLLNVLYKRHKSKTLKPAIFYTLIGMSGVLYVGGCMLIRIFMY